MPKTTYPERKVYRQETPVTSFSVAAMPEPDHEGNITWVVTNDTVVHTQATKTPRN